MSVTIKTNNHWREIISFDELSPDEQASHEYDEQERLGAYFRYKGHAYTLDEFVQFRTPWTYNPEADDPLSQWDAMRSETAFSGVLVKLSDCGDYVKVASYYC